MLQSGPDLGGEIVQGHVGAEEAARLLFGSKAFEDFFDVESVGELVDLLG